MIEVMSLSKQFKDKKAVDCLNFTVDNGEIVGLLGENGAGKTTTLRMLATMLKPTEGTANIEGYDLIEEAEKIRGSIGILFGGEIGLYDRLTARENISYFAELNGMEKEDAKRSIEELTEELKMGDFIDKRVGKFSRGMKQKVAIARAIVHKPKVMLFDEPTAGLDVTAAHNVQDFIMKCKALNRAIIFSSHSMTEVQKLCDRVIIINRGRKIAEGTISELKEKYQEEDLEKLFMDLIGGHEDEK